MAKRNTSRPAVSPDAKEKQLISLAMELAEQQLKDGTASSAVIAHFLKLGSTNQRIEADLKESQAVLARSKAESIKQSESNKELAEKAIEAMKSYQVK